MPRNPFAADHAILNGLKTIDEDDDLIERRRPRNTNIATNTPTPNSLQPEPVLKLATGVGREQPSRHDDVRRVEKALGRTGHLDMRPTHGPTGFFGSRLEDGVKRFQRDNNLKVDGTLKPGGETASALGHSVVMESRVKNPLAGLQDRMARLLDSIASRSRLGLPEPDGDTASRNARSILAMQHNRNLGQVPRLLAETALRNDPKGNAEIDDLMTQAVSEDEPPTTRWGPPPGPRRQPRAGRKGRTRAPPPKHPAVAARHRHRRGRWRRGTEWWIGGAAP